MTAELSTAGQQCAWCDHAGNDVIHDDDKGFICAECAGKLVDDQDTAPDAPDEPQTSPEPEDGQKGDPAAPTQQTGNQSPQTQSEPKPDPAEIEKAQNALWDQAIALDNALTCGATQAAVRIGQLILQSFDVESPYCKPGPDTNKAWGLCVAGFVRRYEIKTHRIARASDWITCAVVYGAASQEARALIDGSESKPFATETLTHFGAFLKHDTASASWSLRVETAPEFEPTLRAVVEEGLKAIEVKARIDDIRRRAAIAPEGRKSSPKTKSRNTAVGEVKDKVKAVCEDHKIAPSALARELSAAGLIPPQDKTGGYNPATMTKNDAQQFAAELALRIDSGDAESLLVAEVIFKALHAALNAGPSKKPAPKATPTVNDAPKAPQAGSRPKLTAEQIADEVARRKEEKHKKGAAA